MAKRKFKTYADCETAFREQERRATIAESALSLLVRGEVNDKRRIGAYQVQVLGAGRSHGGIVAVTYAPGGQLPFTTAAYAEDWATETISHCIRAGINDDEHNALSTLAQWVRGVCRENLDRIPEVPQRAGAILARNPLPEPEPEPVHA